VEERYTEHASQATLFARAEARALQHDYLGTEHVLLGLLREERGLAAQVLASHGVVLAGARAQFVELTPAGDDELLNGEIWLSPRSERVLEHALREALALGHEQVGSEHILLGLVREGEGLAMRILASLGVQADQVRLALVPLMAEGHPTSVSVLLHEQAQARREKEEAIHAQDLERATRLRRREGTLLARTRAELDRRQLVLLEDRRERLEIYPFGERK
jgi:ATP-dependent Clp protease ATP-binding subunit ClpA